MKRAIFRKFIQLLVFALIINSVIFYVAASSMLLRNSRENMQFTLETLDHMFNYSGDLDSQVRRIGQVNAVHDSRLTIIDLEGNVAADTGVADTSAMDNHLEREEVQDAINGGTGDASRYSSTLGRNMLYVARKSADGNYVLRLAVPYAGLPEYLVMLLPAAFLSFVVALFGALMEAERFSASITRPLMEISREMLRDGGDYTEFNFQEYQYPEINVIAETTNQMSRNVREYLDQINREKQIRQEFFSNASHELKTPITSIQGYTELLESGIITDENQKTDFLRRIKKEAANMTSLINDILMISRLEAREVEVALGDVRIAVVLDEVMESLKPVAAANEVLVNVDCEPCTVKANTQQMQELFSNLIGNAIKYNRPGGQVWVSVHREGEERVLRVKDNGVGIPKEAQGRVFERFYRVDKGRSRKQGGTGLGLSIVKHIVNFYKGTIKLTSEVDKGTEFVVRLPVAEAGREENV